MNRKGSLFSSSLFIVLSCMMAFCFAPFRAWSQSGTPQPTPGATPVGTPVPPGLILPTPTPSVGAGCTNYTLTPSTGATITPGSFSTGVQADSTLVITLPFPYTLYDETYTTAAISSHGNIQFGSNAINPYGPCLPDPVFNHTIFAYHTHEHTTPFAGIGLPTDGVYTSVTGSTPNRIFNLEWRAHNYNFPNANNGVGTYENFEIRLYENARRFDIIYGAMEDNGIDGIIGVQKNVGSCYTQYSCHGGGVFPGLMLSFQGQDLIPPSVFITNPAPGVTISSLPEISGEAQDNFGGSGLSAVTVTLRRDTDGLYWNGSAWVATPTALPTVITANTWIVNAPLPNGANLTPGPYTITATAYDVGGNSSSSPISITIGILDTTPPTVAITAPVDFSRFTSFPSILGTAADEPNGSGLDHIDLIIQRQSDGSYWTGTGWNPSPTLLTGSLNGNNWSRTNNLPNGNLLTDSKYQIFTYATDKAGNSSGTSVLITIDKTAPSSVVFNTPTNGDPINKFNLIQGVATDAPHGTGIDHVNLTIRRGSDGFYYTGSGWSPTPTTIDTILSRNATLADGASLFTLRNLPKGTDLRDGRYIITADAFDKLGNHARQTISVTYSVVDRTAPTATITTPAPNSTVTTLAPVQGTAADNRGGSGVARVNLAIQRNSDKKYWDGTAWSVTRVDLTTALTTKSGVATWLRAASLPTGANLENGKYTLIATALDRNSNKGSTSITVTVKKTPTLTVSFKAPAKNATVTALSVVRGTVALGANGGVVSRVDLYIQRQSDKKYWTGNSWSATRTPLVTQLTGQGPVTFSRVSGLPGGSNLSNGSYILTATATLKDGATKSAATTVTIKNSGQSSGVGLSAGTVKASTNSVQLKFTAALESGSASEATHYAVTVNGRAIGVQSAAYNASTHTVTLDLADGALKAGDRVTVSWQGIVDTQLRQVSGQSGTLTTQ